MALAAAVIIAAVTFVLCMAGLHIGKQFGTKLAGKASILAASSSSASVWRSSSPASFDGNVFTEPCIRKKIFRTCAAARPPAFSAQWPRNAGGLWKSCCVFAGSCAISAALRKRQSFFTEISYKETQPGRFLAQIPLAKPPEI